jgi:hypothetical protein
VQHAYFAPTEIPGDLYISLLGAIVPRTGLYAGLLEVLDCIRPDCGHFCRKDVVAQAAKIVEGTPSNRAVPTQLSQTRQVSILDSVSFDESQDSTDSEDIVI